MAVALAVEEKKYTVEEWLELELRAEVRHEFHYGKLVPMAGESKHANLIAGNIKRAIEIPLYEKGFMVFDHDVKAEVAPNGVYRYPDLVVAPVVDDEHDYIVKHPLLIVEVASDGSGQRDRVKKRREYRQIPSLWHYLIADQDEMLVELHTRLDADKWTSQSFTDPEETIELTRFGLILPVAEIYWRVKLER